MYFHTDSGSARHFIEQVARLADERGQRLRIDVDSAGNLRIKRGDGMWSAPIASTPDPYRDASVNAKCRCDSLEVCTRHEV